MLANLKPGESVLDVACGTGTLTTAAKRHVGREGNVYGIEASPAMIARARKKASRANLEITFDTAAIEAMPFPDAIFDVVVSSAMPHHSARPDAAQGTAGSPPRAEAGRQHARDRFRRRRIRAPAPHRTSSQSRPLQHPADIPELSEAGLRDISSGKVGVLDVWFVRSTAPAS